MQIFHSKSKKYQKNALIPNTFNSNVKAIKTGEKILNKFRTNRQSTNKSIQRICIGFIHLELRKRIDQQLARIFFHAFKIYTRKALRKQLMENQKLGK